MAATFIILLTALMTNYFIKVFDVKAKWNGGFAPYGYKHVEGKLEIEEMESEFVRIIFDKYANMEIGANGIAKYLQQIKRQERQNGKSPFFSASLIRQFLDNPVYHGKIFI